MDLSIPILICDENEEIRLLLRDMLTKHGFFHLIEAQTSQEALHFSSKEEQFIVVHKNMLNDELKRQMIQKKKFLIIAQPEDKDTVQLAALFGVNHLISFPYSSKSLVEKIQQLMV